MRSFFLALVVVLLLVTNCGAFEPFFVDATSNPRKILLAYNTQNWEHGRVTLPTSTLSWTHFGQLGGMSLHKSNSNGTDLGRLSFLTQQSTVDLAVFGNISDYMISFMLADPEIETAWFLIKTDQDIAPAADTSDGAFDIFQATRRPTLIVDQLPSNMLEKDGLSFGIELSEAVYKDMAIDIRIENFGPVYGILPDFFVSSATYIIKEGETVPTDGNGVEIDFDTVAVHTDGGEPEENFKIITEPFFAEDKLDINYPNPHNMFIWGAGDSNKDHVFNSEDLVQVFIAGRYEIGPPANWAEGDWNRDGEFDSSDMVVSQQAGWYEQ